MLTFLCPLVVSRNGASGRAPLPLAKNKHAKGHMGRREAPGAAGPFRGFFTIRITKARFSVTFGI